MDSDLVFENLDNNKQLNNDASSHKEIEEDSWLHNTYHRIKRGLLDILTLKSTSDVSSKLNDNKLQEPYQQQHLEDDNVSKKHR